MSKRPHYHLRRFKCKACDTEQTRSCTEDGFCMDCQKALGRQGYTLYFDHGYKLFCKRCSKLIEQRLGQRHAASPN